MSSQACALLKDSGTWGHLSLRVSVPDGLAGVVAVSQRLEVNRQTPLEPANHILNQAGLGPGGLWFRAEALLHVAAVAVTARSGCVTLDGFRALVPAGFKSPGQAAYFAVTYAPGVHDPVYRDHPVPELVAWHVSAAGAQPLDLEVQPEVFGQTQLDPYWPVAEVKRLTVMVVGTGSIGGAAAQALALYGVGRLVLVDPDRLRWHNLVRHVSASRHVGRYKVDSLAEEITHLRPDTDVQGLRLDVAGDADQIRPLMQRADIVLCAADGVTPRRVVSHLARRAGIDAVLACVLDDGRYGEILRLRPWADRGCLTCQREALAATGGLDIEPSLEAGYGTGTRHLPMTAIGGDLHQVGQLAAKVAVATALESRGHPDQRLPGEHAVWALRPRPGRPAPFDLDRAGDLRWGPAHPPVPGCPTCQAP